MAQMYKMSRIVKESLPILLSILGFSLFTGHNLETAFNIFVTEFPFFIIMVPAFINMAGGFASVFAARITSRLLLGELDRKYRPYGILFSDLIGLALVALTGFIMLSLITFGINAVFFGVEVSLFALLAIILVSGIFTTVLMCGIGLFVANMVVRKKLDPDNFTPPIITTLGDAVGTLLLVFLIRLILLV